MKTMTPRTQSMCQSPHRDVLWIVEVQAGAETVAWASREVTIPEYPLLPALESFERRHEASSPLPTGILHLVMNNLPRRDNGPQSFFQRHPPIGLHVRFLILFLEKLLEPSVADLLPLFSGRLTSATSTDCGWTLRASDYLDEARTRCHAGNFPCLFGRVKKAPLIPITGQAVQFVLANHPCISINAVHADGRLLPPEDYTASVEMIDGQWVQILTFDAWPADVEGTGQAGHLDADAEGYAEDDNLIENPAHVLRVLLTHPLFASLPVDMLDSASFEQAAARLDDHGYRFNRRIEGPQPLGELLQSALRESRCRLAFSDTRLRLCVDGVGEEPLCALDDNVILDRMLALAQPQRPLASVQLLHGDGMETVECVRLEESAHFPRHELYCQWLANESHAPADLARHIAGQSWIITRQMHVKSPLATIALDLADSVQLPEEPAASLLSIHQDQPHVLEHVFALEAIARTVWSYGNMSIAIASDLSRLIFLAEDQPIAVLWADGRMHLRGQVVERSLGQRIVEQGHHAQSR